MLILVFDALIDAQVAIKKIWVETVRDAVTDGLPVRNGGELVTDLTGWTDNQIAALMICGKLETEIEMLDGLTLRYDLIEKSISVEKWFFQKCAEKYLPFLTNYEILELPADWVPPAPEG